MNSIGKQRILAIIILIVLVPVGFYTKFYSGPAQTWINNSFGGFLYEIFWCLVFFIVFPQTRPKIIAITVFVITCLLEFLQLWHPSFLELIRSDFIGRTIIGNSFNWLDFLYYITGSLAGWLIVKSIEKNSSSN